MRDFEINLSGARVYAALGFLVAIGFCAGVAATFDYSAPPYRNANWSLIEQDRGKCVYAADEGDRLTFAQYDLADFGTAECPRHNASMVIVNGRAVIAANAPE